MSGVGQLRRVLVVRLDNIGDVVMLTPALRALRQALPGAHLTLLASPAGALVGPLLPWVDEVLGRRVVWQDAGGKLSHDVERERALVADLAERRLDAAFVFTSFAQSPHAPAYACYLANIPVRVGASREFGGALLSHAAPWLPDSVHEVDRNLHLVESFGLPLAGRHLELALPDDAVDGARAHLTSAGLDPDRPYLLVAPGASCSARRYDPMRLRQVCEQLAARTDMPVVVVGTPREEALAQAVAQAPRAASLAGRTSVPELAALVAGAALVVANNSAPLHLAEAFRRPLVVLFAGTERESQFRPRFAPARVLRRETACTPCRAFTCPYELECLDLQPSAVVAAALDLLEVNPTGGPLWSACAS